MTCEEMTEWGRCQQPTHTDSSWVCKYHHRMRTGTLARIDRYYHEKVAKGLVALTDDYLDAAELGALFGGRTRHDGRWQDLWTV